MALSSIFGCNLKPVLDKLEAVDALVRHEHGLILLADLDTKAVQTEVASLKADVAAIKAGVQALLDRHGEGHSK
jgi:hypothetical protein